MLLGLGAWVSRRFRAARGGFRVGAVVASHKMDGGFLNTVQVIFMRAVVMQGLHDGVPCVLC